MLTEEVEESESTPIWSDFCVSLFARSFVVKFLVCLFERSYPGEQTLFPRRKFRLLSISRLYKDDVTGNVIVGAELGVGVGSHLTALVLILYSGK